MIYTFFTEHKLEMNITQIEACDTNSAVNKWRTSLPFSTAYDENIEDNNFTEVEGILNCWCTSCLDSDENIVIANSVLTDAKI